MKIKHKLIAFSTIYSLVILMCLLITFALLSMNTRRDEVYNNTEVNLKLLSDMVEHELHHYVTLVESIAANGHIEESLNTSNDEFDLLSSVDRENTINTLNQTWVDTVSDDDPFITDILENELSTILTDIVESEVDYYGEIFITNKYGLMIGSSGRLSTLSHAHKYWWQGAYNDNEPQVYFDDRGYDESVGEIVLGVVLPIYYDGELGGMIKVNVIITEMIDEHIENLNNLSNYGEYIITRQDGLIVGRDGVVPLSETVEESVLNYYSDEDYLGVITYNDDKHYLGIRNMTFDHFDEDVFFGGKEVSSTDHMLGSTGGVWKIVFLSQESELNRSSVDTIHITILIGSIIILVGIPVSIYIGNTQLRKIYLLQKNTKKMTEGIFGQEITIQGKDELSQLTNDFNTLSKTLKSNTTSISNYEIEIKKSQALEKKLLEVIQIDELTKLYNRYGFNEFLNKYFYNANRDNTNIGFIIFDIDDFKDVNDTYGHTKGDQVLQAIAENVTKVLRKGDVFCRWGGEEFVVLTPNTNKDEIYIVAEKIRTTVMNIKLDLVPKITVSVGVTISNKSDTSDSIITRADKALYVAKTTGKNKTETIS